MIQVDPSRDEVVVEADAPNGCKSAVVRRPDGAAAVELITGAKCWAVTLDEIVLAMARSAADAEAAHV
jgi:hypothetical protein